VSPDQKQGSDQLDQKIGVMPHGNDPEFGNEFLADEAADTGLPLAEQAVWRTPSTYGRFSWFCE